MNSSTLTLPDDTFSAYPNFDLMRKNDPEKARRYFDAWMGAEHNLFSDGPSLQARKTVEFSWKGGETQISLSPGPMIEFGQGHTYYTFYRKDDLLLDK